MLEPYLVRLFLRTIVEMVVLALVFFLLTAVLPFWWRLWVTVVYVVLMPGLLVRMWIRGQRYRKQQEEKR